MSFRRSDFDVTNRVQVTDPGSVRAEILRIYKATYSRPHSPVIARAFDDVVRLYLGEYPGYSKCDTAYHDLQHIMDVTLAMARLIDGYERTRGESPTIGEKLFQLGIICALFHDCGYIRRQQDTRHREGAEYTRTHVTRGGRFLKEYLPTLGLDEYSEVAASVLHFTGYEKPVAKIKVPPIYRLLGSLLGSADIIAQMSDRCYLEKCRDRLFPEFVVGGITKQKTEVGEVVVFESPDDLLRKTPGFYANATKRLKQDLGGAFQFAEAHFGGANPYMDAVERNISFVESTHGDPPVLRRHPPSTLR